MEGIKIALDAWERLDEHPCRPIIESLCSLPVRHDRDHWGFGIVVAGPNTGRVLHITCGGATVIGPHWYWAGNLGAFFAARVVWTPWSPRSVPYLAPCSRYPY